VAWQWLISGFGEVRPTTGDRGYGQTVSGPSYAQAVKFDLRYPGQVFDEETGLSYNLHRYYDAATGRYMQADPIGLAGGWNRFGYVGGDPLNAIDPDGLNAVVALNRIAEVGRGLYYRYGPAITEFIAGASGVNGAVASPAAINPLVAQIPTGVSRILPIVRGISEGVESGAFACVSNSPQLYRGGNGITARLGVDVKAAPDGLIHPFGKNGKAQGLSLNLNPHDQFIQRYGGAFPVNSIPGGLQTLQSGKPGHYVISPVDPMGFEEYQRLLNKVELGIFNFLP
jgi:RHS repeat-associated protein